jgi:hypothetical protein
VCLTEEIDHALHCGFAHLDMKVAELSDGESVEGLRQVRRLNAIVPYVDLCRIANASPIEARRHEDGADQDRCEDQILAVKEVYASAEDLPLMALLDPEALSRVTPPESLLKDCQNILVRHGLRESFWGGKS